MSVIFFTLVTLIIGGSKNNQLSKCLQENYSDVRKFKEIVEDLRKYFDVLKKVETVLSVNEMNQISLINTVNFLKENPEEKFIVEEPYLVEMWNDYKWNDEEDLGFHSSLVDTNLIGDIFVKKTKKFYETLVELRKKMRSTSLEEINKELCTSYLEGEITTMEVINLNHFKKITNKDKSEL